MGTYVACVTSKGQNWPNPPLNAIVPGCEASIDEAIHWYRKGAEAGDGLAMTNLGTCYADGEGVEIDEAQAVYWHRKGREAGDPLAITNLAQCYEYEIGVARDMELAFELYLEAAKQDYVLAMACVGECYQLGTGVEKNLGKARYWLRRAADGGETTAAEILREIR